MPGCMVDMGKYWWLVRIFVYRDGKTLVADICVYRVEKILITDIYVYIGMEKGSNCLSIARCSFTEAI